MVQKYIDTQTDTEAQERELVKKYNSYTSLSKDQRAKYVKNTNLHPAELAPYDRLANAFWKWRSMASGPEAAKLSPEQRAAAADHFYDGLLLPTYEALDAQPMSKELWRQQAYASALKYDPEQDVQYSASPWKGAISGLEHGVSTALRIEGIALDMLGSVIKFNTGGASWYDWDKQERKAGKTQAEINHDAAATIPLIGLLSKKSAQLSSAIQFYADATPAKGFMESASSVLAEQAVYMPLYESIGGGLRGIGGVAAESIPQVANLTETLNATAAGRRVLPLVLSGVEGAATGAALTAPGEDPKREAWQSAVGFMAGHTVFGVLGAAFTGVRTGVSRIAGRSTAKLGNVLEGEAKIAFDKKLEELNLGTKGKHMATPEEQVDAYKKVYANYSSAGGVPALKALAQQAVEFLKARSGKSHLDVLKEKQDLLEADRAKWNPVFNVMRVIQNLAGKKSISDMSEDELKSLLTAHDKFIGDALTKLPQTVPVKGIAGAEASKVASTPSGAAQIKRKIASLKAADAKSGMNAGKPDSFYSERATKWYLEQNQKGAEEAAAESIADPAKEVKEVAKKRTDVVNPVPVPGEAAGHMKYRSQYEHSPSGRVTGYSMSAARDFKVYASKAAKAAGFGNLKEWFSDLSDGDFIKDLEDWFYPKDLKEGGFFFEHESSDPGKNPNFLAFMYNYVDHMPPEMQQELRTRLTDQAKVALHLSGKVDEERLIRYYALSMWNHVDDFLGALPQHKGEFNLYRSTQSDLLNPTKYQKMLLEEKVAEERKNLQSMYRKKPEILKAVMGQYEALAGERYKTLGSGAKNKIGSVSEQDVQRQSHRQELNTRIGDMQLEDKQFEPWRF